NMSRRCRRRTRAARRTSFASKPAPDTDRASRRPRSSRKRPTSTPSSAISRDSISTAKMLNRGQRRGSGAVHHRNDSPACGRRAFCRRLGTGRVAMTVMAKILAGGVFAAALMSAAPAAAQYYPGNPGYGYGNPGYGYGNPGYGGGGYGYNQQTPINQCV